MREPIGRYRRWVVALTTVWFLFGTSLALAVIQNVSLVDADGNPLGNVTVTIQFPDGHTEEEDTDDKGFLIFDSDDDGDYIITWPGGSKTITVKTGGGWSGTTKAVTGTVVGAGIAAGVVDDSSTTPTSPPPSGSPPPPPPMGSIDGNYDISSSIVSNPDMHPDFYDGIQVQITTSGTSFLMTSADPNNSFAMMGTTDGTNADGTTDLCMYAGISDVTCDAVLTFPSPPDGTFSGTCRACVSGNCPDSNGDGMNQPIEVLCFGTMSGSQ